MKKLPFSEAEDWSKLKVVLDTLPKGITPSCIYGQRRLATAKLTLIDKTSTGRESNKNEYVGGCPDDSEAMYEMNDKGAVTN